MRLCFDLKILNQKEKICSLYMECSICLQEYSSFIRLKCGHKFHKKCVKDWSQKSYRCPLCRNFMGYFTLEDGDSLLPHFDEVFCVEEVIKIS